MSNCNPNHPKGMGVNRGGWRILVETSRLFGVWKRGNKEVKLS
jgi:hypothetical protein